MFDDYANHWKFDTVDFVSFPNCQFIHPLQQFNTQLIFDSLYCNKNVSLLVVFGSSVTMRCNSYSDIDIYIETLTDEEPYIPWKYLTKEVDILKNFKSWDTPIAREISVKGIALFDRR